MPFTLAHPAAVLPFRRFCPRYLSLGALIVGSIVPDAGYCFGRLHLDLLSHSFVGSFAFSLPMGMLMLAMIYGLRQPVVARLPAAQQEIFAPLCRQPVPAWYSLIISLLIGAWTHLVWDSFTHTHGWCVQHFSLLRFPIARSGSHTLLLCHLLWYIFSFGGVACVCFWYERWVQKTAPAETRITPRTSLWHALFIGLLVLPIELLHHMANDSISFAVVGICSLALVIGAALGLGKHLPTRPQKES